MEGAGGTARPRALQLLELGVESADLTLDAPDGLPGGRRVCEDGFAVYLECAHVATLGARLRRSAAGIRIRGRRRFLDVVQEGDAHTEGRAPAGRLEHLDVSVMLGDDARDDREPEPRSARLARARGVGAPEPLEDLLAQLRGHAGPVVD